MQTNLEGVWEILLQELVQIFFFLGLVFFMGGFLCVTLTVLELTGLELTKNHLPLLGLKTCLTTARLFFFL